MSNGDCLVKVTQTKFCVLQTPQTEEENDIFQHLTRDLLPERMIGNCQVWINPKREEVHFRAKSIVLATGGKQIVHPQFFSWFPDMVHKREQVITSDYFLKKEGFIKTMTALGHLQKHGVKKKIVIVGGSHSGFSCAWMLINQRPAHESDENYEKLNLNGKPLGATRRVVNNCQLCCQCPVKSQKCRSCICKCFGFFTYNEWNVHEHFSMFPNSQPLDFDNDTDQVTILYRDDIKVFYAKVRDAIEDGYTNFKQSDFTNENGYLYSFTGLRGDAKELYRNITKGYERRVRLVKAESVEKQARYIDSADVVIWACGYKTNEVEISEMVSQGKG